MLRAYSWSGNVRELFAAVESTAIWIDGDRIEAQHLSTEIRAAAQRDGLQYGLDDDGGRYRVTATYDRFTVANQETHNFKLSRRTTHG
ncbi:MAG: hypothetical protein ACR2M1_16300 [Gemmatimonadaceae bacterium]